MLQFALLSAIAGLFAKLADEVSENKLKAAAILAYSFALIYGLSLGLASVFTPLSSLFVALALASILSGKIDHNIHLAGTVAFSLVLMAFPITQFDAWLFSAFIISGLLDELKLNFGRIFYTISTERLWTPAFAFAVFLWDGSWIFLAAIICFDIAYRIAGHYSRAKEAKPIAKAKRAGKK